jgi:hypothetical protein
MPTIEQHGLTFDARPDRIDFRDLYYQPPLVSLHREYPPATVIDKYLTRYCDDGMILNQGTEGACTGFGLAAVVNYLCWERAKRSNLEAVPPPKVSPRMLYHMARLYDEWDGEDYQGSSCRGAMKGWHRHGICTEELWPYDGNSKAKFVKPKDGWNQDAAERPLGAYYRINKDSLLEMQAAIGEVHAIYASAKVHEGWWLKKTNRLTAIVMEGKKEVGGHAFAIVGYRPDGFIIQNSWGPRWGYRGFAVLTYPDWLQNGMDAWVAVLGAPVAVKGSPVALSTSPLQDLPKKGANGRVALSGGRVTFVGARNPAVAPWTEDQAYEHSLVLGNDGRPLHRLLAAGTAEHNVEIVAEELPGQWLAESRTRKLAIYAHGGLNDERASIQRIRILAPYFKANGIYPLFVTWRTGFAESLTAILRDRAKECGIDLELLRARGMFDDVREAILEARDRAFEAAAEQILAKAVWTQMKQNAEAAAAGGALGLVATHLQRLRQSADGVEIHLVGHSAGAILLGHLLERMIARKVPAGSMSLYAPACTMAFATRQYGKAFSKGILDPGTVSFDLLSDERELGDCVGPYGKSLLYLVSRALEEMHKMPLLGQAAAWDVPNGHKTDVFNSRKAADIKAWLKLWGNRPKPQLIQDRQISDGQEMIDATHGSFDNNVAVVGRSLKRILGRPLAIPVENLHGF